MSHLTYMEKLLDGVEVEWKALGGLVENLDSMRKPITSGLRESGSIPYYGASGIVDYVKDYIFDGDFLLVSEDGANLLARNTPIAFSISGKSWVNNHAHILKFNTYAERRFVDIYLNSIDLTPYISGAAQPKLNQKNLNSIPIPIPCPDNPEKSLAIQAEIVRILDAFTELTAELTAELNMRKKQYNYYRDQLLSFEEGEVEWKTLGEITRISSASRVHKNEWTTSGVPFFRTSDVISLFNGVKNTREDAFISNELYEKLSLKSGKLQKDDILVTGGGTIGIPYVVPTDEPLYFKDADLLCIKKSKQLNSKFLYHYFLTTKFRVYLENISHNSTIAHYTISQATKTPVPVPPLAEQARIVAILDKFNALTNFITEGLPREIELRQKQYEYYRDLLLSFPKSHSDEAS